MLSPSLAAVAILLTGAIDPQPAGPTCQEAPDGSSEQVIKCYDVACDTYRAAWHACPDSACRAAAGAQYSKDIGDCWIGYFNTVSSDAWVTFWYSGDEFGISFDHDIPVGARVFQF